MKILVTGGAGFIGANFLNHFVPRHPEHTFVNVDKLTYAANLGSLERVAKAENYRLEVVDIGLIASAATRRSSQLAGTALSAELSIWSLET